MWMIWRQWRQLSTSWPLTLTGIPPAGKYMSLVHCRKVVDVSVQRSCEYTEFIVMQTRSRSCISDEFLVIKWELAWCSRFCSTSVTSVHQMENGFNIWSFQGKLLYRLPRDRFFQVRMLFVSSLSNRIQLYQVA